MTYSEYNFSMLQNIVYIEKEDVVLATFIDITKEEELAKQEYEKKLETIDLAQRVIHKQMMVAQEIAGLLGETTAEQRPRLQSSAGPCWMKEVKARSSDGSNSRRCIQKPE